MLNLNEISEKIHHNFESQTLVRDKALAQARQLTRHAAHAIRAIHRGEEDLAFENINEARTLCNCLKNDLTSFPDIYYAGYTQDAIKEYVEASITVAVILDRVLPSPADLDVEDATYINGLAEVVGELRRRCLDILRLGYSQEAERLLACMDDIYNLLVTIDYPDAITHGLRRQTDLVRGILERTRGDLTLSLREENLKRALDEASRRFQPFLNQHADD